MDALQSMVEEIEKQNNHKYAKFLRGKLGEDELESMQPDERFEMCEAFIQSHETDAFKYGKDIIYVNDPAYPDMPGHREFLRRLEAKQRHEDDTFTRIQNKKIVRIAKDAFARAGLK